MLIKKIRTRALATLAAAGLAGLIATPALSATNFEADVAASIDAGLVWLKTIGAYSGGYNSRAAGLANLALLEKRASGNPADPPQGYNGASAADKVDLLSGANWMVGTAINPGRGLDTYRDGNYLAALSEYILTGGPDPAAGSTLAAINNLVDDLLANQRVAANGWPDIGGVYPAGQDQGYWCYTTGGCRDASTTQYASLGLAAAEAVYQNPSFADAARLAKIKSALNTTAKAYVLNAGTGSDSGTCGVVDAKERGHGYHSPVIEGYKPSLQQTASGMFVQALAGSDVNSPGVQSYLDWLKNHYRYSNLDNMGNSWPGASYGYYLWSSFKGTEFLIASGTPVAGGNVDPASLGTLAPDATCTDRELQRNPAVDPQVSQWGAGGAGFYSATTKGQYYDFAYSIMGWQCNATNGNAQGSSGSYGAFFCGGFPGAWEYESSQSYMLLVLQRAAGVIIPTVTLTASPASVLVGQKSTLTWTSSNANTCAASTGSATDGWGGAVAVNASQMVTETVPGPHIYTITCTTGSQSVHATATVTYTAIATCDLDHNGVIDKRDIAMFTPLLGKHVPPAPAAADANGDGIITVQDARLCTLKCTLANCAIPPNT